MTDPVRSTCMETAPGPAGPMHRGSPAICSLRVDRETLVIPPFQIERFGQRFRQTTELRIELRSLEPDRYRILAVHDFWSEDDQPDLSVCLAGVFLARLRADGAWEEPERWPVECRTLAVLGYVCTRTCRLTAGDAD